MSRINLEWEVEAERIAGTDSESPEEKSRRRRSCLLLLALVCLLAAVIILGLLILRQRALDIERQFAQLLQDTVKAEVAALRIGDLSSFLELQSADELDWMNRQRATFQQYSALKADGAIELTGSILGVEIDVDRARVLVQENINELPYARLWFYRRGDEGWRHVAQDTSYWGEAQTLESSRVIVNFRDVDQNFAAQVKAALTDWLEKGCAILDCAGLPRLEIDIVSAAAEDAVWLDEQNLRLQIRSPYIDIARADTPFDGRRQLLVSGMLAERLVNAHTGYLSASAGDARYLRDSAIAWLSETFTRLDSGATLMRSLAANYGADKIAALLSKLSASSDMSLVQEVIGRRPEAAGLDWRDFVEWRLALESEFLSARQQNEWLALYDTAEENVRLLAYERYSRNAAPMQYDVIDALVWSAPGGGPQLRATVRAAGDNRPGSDIILFNLVNGQWKRAN